MKHELSFKVGDRVEEELNWRRWQNRIRQGSVRAAAFRGCIAVWWDAADGQPAKLEDVPAHWLIKLDAVRALGKLA